MGCALSADSVLSKEIDDEADWQSLGLAAFEKAWNKEKAEGAQAVTLRPYGLCAGEFAVPADFDDPLPSEILKTFIEYKMAIATVDSQILAYPVSTL